MSSYLKFRIDGELGSALKHKVHQLEVEEGVKMSQSQLARMILRSALTSDQTLRGYTDREGLSPIEFPDLGAAAELSMTVRQAAGRALGRATANLGGYLEEELGALGDS